MHKLIATRSAFKATLLAARSPKRSVHACSEATECRRSSVGRHLSGLRDEGLLSGQAGTDELERALTKPFKVANSSRKYRFARQKAKYLCGAINAVRALSPTRDGRQLRSQLTGITGIGPKTASWIVRNHLGSDDVAILDVHIIRAGVAAGVFPATADPARNYFTLGAALPGILRRH